MRVLVACEESQIVCKAFRAKGHEAYSCDIQECSGGHPEWHYQMDVFEVIEKLGPWDLLIGHPPCTYLSNMGAVHLFRGGEINHDRYKKGLEAKDFFIKMLNSNIKKICIENPIPSAIYGLPKQTQQIHPYHFGEPFKKATRLWLKGLDPLWPTNIVWKRVSFVSAGGNKHKKKDGAVSLAKERSKTFPGIAQAMADQWG